LLIEALDTWILFHRAVLGMEPGESLELSDPFGLVRSCGVANASRTVRVVLNVSQSRGTQMAKAIATQGGATVHHIAFACTDIFATMGALKRNGAKFVAISDNYYDDLASRFEIPAEVLERMSARHSVRAHGRRRVFARLFGKLCGSLLLRDCPADRRLRRLRCRQRPRALAAQVQHAASN
jgi:4-hydroxyphenylpyruvate dioxygenase-like putative hemolysin